MPSVRRSSWFSSFRRRFRNAGVITISSLSGSIGSFGAGRPLSMFMSFHRLGLVYGVSSVHRNILVDYLLHTSEIIRNDGEQDNTAHSHLGMVVQMES